MSGSQTPGAASPATNSLTPMELDVNAATTPEQQQQLQRTPSGSTEFQNPNQVPPGIVKQEGASFNPLNNPLFAVPAPAASSTATATAPVNQPDVELNRREKTLAEFLAMMDNYAPIIPDAVTDYYLSRTGFDCDDVRIKRLLALATQKFVADIATDAFQYCKVRQSGNRKTGKDRKAVLTMDDLSAALAEYGVNVKKPEYYS
ncbi:hypothetical protein VTP01DRAFT_5621 [Rhizomucor pusillus]|uniref:uncharacterized protein n=1 Tax=Rhizomucor pusillus TaxID=4840 RepID=UPI00374403C7